MEQDSKELSPRPLANAPKLSMLIKLFKILVLCWIHNFNHNDAPKTLNKIWIQLEQDSNELSPRPLANAPKLLMLIKLFKLLVLCWIHNFNHFMSFMTTHLKILKTLM